MRQNYKFSETDVNRKELQQYREESDSVFSFVKENCELAEGTEVGFMELFNAYKTYCEECGLKPFAQKMFVGQLTGNFATVTRSVDKTGKRRTFKGIRLCEIIN